MAQKKNSISSSTKFKKGQAKTIRNAISGSFVTKKAAASYVKKNFGDVIRKLASE